MSLSIPQRKALALVPKVAGFSSFLFSALVCYTVLRDEAKRKSPYHRLVCGISVVDMSSSFWLGLSTWPMPADSGALYAVGNDTTCRLQGFWTQAGIASSFYNVSLSLYYVLVIRLGWKEAALRKVEPWFHIVPLVFGLGTATLALIMDVLGNASLWCWILPTAPTYRWAIFYGPLWSMIVIVTCNCLAVWFHVRRVEKKSLRFSIYNHGNNNNGHHGSSYWMKAEAHHNESSSQFEKAAAGLEGSASLLEACYEEEEDEHDESHGDLPHHKSNEDSLLEEEASPSDTHHAASEPARTLPQHELLQHQEREQRDGTTPQCAGADRTRSGTSPNSSYQQRHQTSGDAIIPPPRKRRSFSFLVNADRARRGISASFGAAVDPREPTDPQQQQEQQGPMRQSAPTAARRRSSFTLFGASLSSNANHNRSSTVRRHSFLGNSITAANNNHNNNNNRSSSRRQQDVLPQRLAEFSILGSSSSFISEQRRSSHASSSDGRPLTPRSSTVLTTLSSLDPTMTTMSSVGPSSGAELLSQRDDQANDRDTNDANIYVTTQEMVDAETSEPIRDDVARSSPLTSDISLGPDTSNPLKSPGGDMEKESLDRKKQAMQSPPRIQLENEEVKVEKLGHGRNDIETPKPSPVQLEGKEGNVDWEATEKVRPPSDNDGNEDEKDSSESAHMKSNGPAAVGQSFSRKNVDFADVGEMPRQRSFFSKSFSGSMGGGLLDSNRRSLSGSGGRGPNSNRRSLSGNSGGGRRPFMSASFSHSSSAPSRPGALDASSRMRSSGSGSTMVSHRVSRVFQSFSQKYSQQTRLTNRLKRTKQVAKLCFRYAIAFYINWVPLTTIRIIQIFDPTFVNFGLFLMAGFFTPIQGLPNFLIYLGPLIWQETNKQWQRIQRQRELQYQQQLREQNAAAAAAASPSHRTSHSRSSSFGRVCELSSAVALGIRDAVLRPAKSHKSHEDFISAGGGSSSLNMVDWNDPTTVQMMKESVEEAGMNWNHPTTRSLVQSSIEERLSESHVPHHSFAHVSQEFGPENDIEEEGEQESVSSHPMGHEEGEDDSNHSSIMEDASYEFYAANDENVDDDENDETPQDEYLSGPMEPPSAVDAASLVAPERKSVSIVELLPEDEADPATATAPRSDGATDNATTLLSALQVQNEWLSEGMESPAATANAAGSNDDPPIVDVDAPF